MSRNIKKQLDLPGMPSGSETIAIFERSEMKIKVKARQSDVYYFIKHYIAEYKNSPTYKEICTGCLIKSKSHAFSLVKHLIDRGYLKKTKEVNLNRQLDLTKKRYRLAASHIRAIALPKKNNLYREWLMNQYPNKKINVLRGVYIYD